MTQKLFFACLLLATCQNIFADNDDNGSKKTNSKLDTSTPIQLKEVTVVSSSVKRINESAFNAVGVDTKSLQNTTQNLSDALRQVPGVKLREMGGVGSDMQLMLDGFSGKHVKVFIDGVPQEGVGQSFGLNNIPVTYADHIEVYRGVVPVEFGTDAIGGVINVVTKKTARRWYLDASYSYGSFNTHKSNVDFGQYFKNGLTYEINFFQNYSDNNYQIDATGVKHFLEGGGSQQNAKKTERVERLHDAYHNEALVVKVGVLNKSWADRLMLSATLSQSYKEIQTDTRQTVAFGERHRKGWSVMPALEYRKRDLLKGLDVAATLNYNRNMTNNIDTATYEYNWLGDRRYKNGRKGEVSYQDTKAYNDNWNATFRAVYRPVAGHTITLNHLIQSVDRKTNTATVDLSNSINKVTVKRITGLSYQLAPTDRWNATVFVKNYDQRNSGPLALSGNDNTSYVKTHNDVSTLGYGAAAAYYILRGWQLKLSYERACRLPTTDELFGDNDLERGKFELKPERSHNYNLNMNYSHTFDRQHALYLEGGLIYRLTKDYIKRTTENVSGTYYGAYSNHGRVETKGYNVGLRYDYQRWLSVGGNWTQMDVRDDEKTQETGSKQTNLTYGARMPNLPYQFANADMTLRWHDLGGKGNLLSCTYDLFYTHSFPLFSEVYGSASNKMTVPTQTAHNLTLTYAMKHGKYNFSLECHNLTDAKLYDNFNLQKAGRAFYGKVRINIGG
ncbi:TonB-dependent receptor plug domain-containing protein [Prevotella communis]|uniref:TonB-dependent receptor domain-containing protein n=1 Tax=Prevotella communis TaxID=2913614 RepID=UPI001EDC58CA|nr:TonB-dependent receptor [Prevotella communis]UKK62137.1 TonB-dependent receptor plug domain-containing protein [Prevotella communis]UKK64964.1 TonB-dependent receptor plug domain-containing protein [Prevotella communis]UKK67337.1 TonB-dependent receptor plug domain-containing protein [Prevotella communis]